MCLRRRPSGDKQRTSFLKWAFKFKCDKPSHDPSLQQHHYFGVSRRQARPRQTQLFLQKETSYTRWLGDPDVSGEIQPAHLWSSYPLLAEEEDVSRPPRSTTGPQRLDPSHRSPRLCQLGRWHPAAPLKPPTRPSNPDTYWDPGFDNQDNKCATEITTM